MNIQDAKKIVVVDDTEIVTQLICAALKQEGFSDVTGYTDPDQALEEINSKGKPDLIITDYNMPGMNGIELLDKAGVSESVIITAEASALKQKTSTYRILEKTSDLCNRLLALLRNKDGANTEE